MFVELVNKMNQTETRLEAIQDKMEIRKRDSGRPEAHTIRSVLRGSEEESQQLQMLNLLQLQKPQLYHHV